MTPYHWGIRYLSLSVFFFIFNWLQPWVIIPVMGIFAFMVYNLMERKFNYTPVSKPVWISILVISIVIVILTPTGNFFGTYNYDILKTRATMVEIASGNPRLLDNSNDVHKFYLGYYLAPGFISKVISPYNTSLLTYIMPIWTVIGLFIAGLMVASHFKPRWQILAVLFIFTFGNISVITDDLSKAMFNQQVFAGHLSSMFIHLYFAPQHAIAAFIGTMTIFYHYKNNSPLFDYFGMIVLIIFWSPFVAAGLAGITSGTWMYRLLNKWSKKLESPLQ